MFTYDEKWVVRSKVVALINQIGAAESTHKLVVQPLFLKLFPHHLFAHLSDAAIEWNGHTSLNAPVVTA